MDRPVTTLFMLMSVDGKISTGASDLLDFDKDLPGIPGVREGLRQYYEIEQTTDLWSFNTGRVQAKLGGRDDLGVMTVSVDSTGQKVVWSNAAFAAKVLNNE